MNRLKLLVLKKCHKNKCPYLIIDLDMIGMHCEYWNKNLTTYNNEIYNMIYGCKEYKERL